MVCFKLVCYEWALLRTYSVMSRSVLNVYRYQSLHGKNRPIGDCKSCEQHQMCPTNKPHWASRKWRTRSRFPSSKVTKSFLHHPHLSYTQSECGTLLAFESQATVTKIGLLPMILLRSAWTCFKTLGPTF